MITQKKIHADIPMSPDEILKLAYESLPMLTISGFIMWGLTECKLPYTIAGNCASRIMERGIQLGPIVPKYHHIGCEKYGTSLHMDIKEIEIKLWNDPIARTIVISYLDYLRENDDEFGEHIAFLKRMEESRANHRSFTEVGDHT